jgi:putative peptidoglycan lipid II flippase
VSIENLTPVGLDTAARRRTTLPGRAALGAKRLFWQRHTARQGITVLGVLALLSRGLGFVRELAVAYFFGASRLVDAYRIGETINSLSSSVARQAFDVVGVPLLVERRTRQGEESEKALFSSFCTVAFLVAAGISFLTLVLAPVIVRLFAPRLDPAALRLAAALTRIMVPVAAAATIAGAAGAYYNARRQFAVPRLFDPVVNVVAIVALVLFARRFGVFGLAAGWSAGHVLGLLVALLPLAVTGHRLIRKLRDPGVREFVVLSLPVLVAAVIQPVNIAVGRAFASFLQEGSIAMLGYADRLFSLPCFLLAASLTPVFYTKASELAAAGETELLLVRTRHLLGRLALVLAPLSLALFIGAEPIVRLLYERGAFTSSATATTARAFAWLSLGLFPYAAVSVMTAALRGRKNMKTPVYAAIAGVALNIALDALLVRPLGLPGLALATSSGLAVSATVLWLALNRRRRA